MAAKLALGENLADVRNSVTGTTTACFEPALDYVVTKVPQGRVDGMVNRSPQPLGNG